MFTVEFDNIVYALQKSGGASVYWYEITSRISRMNDVLVTESVYHKRLRGIPVISKADIFHSSHFRFSLFGKSKNITTAHDLTYEKGLVANSIGSKLNLYERKLSYFTADAIICISINTQNDLLEIYPSLQGRCPIYVIHHGLNINTTTNTLNEDTNFIDYPYILFVGSRGGYKNFLGALEGYFLSGVWRDGVKLICTGNKFTDKELELFVKMGLERMVICEEHVETKRLYELYKSAHCLLYTSLYEGFGLPPIEAMSCGCPVVASNISSIPEVVGVSAILINPHKYDEISSGILQLQDVNIRNELIYKGKIHAQKFSWDKSATEHFEVYKEITGL